MIYKTAFYKYRYAFLLALLTLTVSPAVMADPISYFSDPVFKPLSEADEHPLSDLAQLAEQGDPRAQFILGDLYAKGKGGFPKDLAKSKAFFENSAGSGYKHSLVRLAAMAKTKGDLLETYKWYSLAIETFPYGETRLYLIQQRNDLARNHDMTKDDIRDAKRRAKDWRLALTLPKTSEPEPEQNTDNKDTQTDKTTNETQKAKGEQNDQDQS